MQKKLSIYFSFLISPLNCNRNNALNISHVRCLDMFKIQDNKSFDFSINNNFGARLTLINSHFKTVFIKQNNDDTNDDTIANCCFER